MGPSGSGKSTLLHLLAGLDTPTEGKVFIGDIDLTTLSDKQLTQLRRDRVGFVFQAFNLIPTLTAGENITLPLDIAGRGRRPELVRHGRRHRGADATGCTTARRSCPAASSSASPARGRSCRGPRSSSPTSRPGTSTPRAAPSCSTSCGRAVDEHGQTIVMVTHDAHAAAHADRVVFLADGNVVQEMRSPTADAILDEIKSLEG